MRIGQGLVIAGLAVALLAGSFLLIREWLDPFHLPRGDWRLYKRNFVGPDGRVIDTGNGNTSHSEGQGYGLLIAVAFKDRTTFDRIWAWTEKNLQIRPKDKLLAWSWKPDEKGGGAVTDSNNASDGDLLVAWALFRAHQLWGDYRHQQAAQQILADLARLDVVKTDDGTYFLPGTDGFLKDDATTLNPSYYVFPALVALANAFPGTPWKEVEKSGYALLEKARFGSWRLTPDWVLAGEPMRISPDFPPVFGYNAVRIPLYLGWQNQRSRLMQPFARFWKQFKPRAFVPTTVNLETDAFGVDPALPGMRAIAAFTIACAENQHLTVRALPVLKKDESYFSASLNLLTKIAIRESFGHK
ncbi:MAG: glycosyl hydrolase family 8 [Terrimicrobiaceae bacterium]